MRPLESIGFLHRNPRHSLALDGQGVARLGERLFLVEHLGARSVPLLARYHRVVSLWPF